MATYSGNDLYIAIDSTSLGTYFTGSLNYEPTIEQQDITAGSGVDWRQRTGGLFDGTLSFMLVYDVTNISTYIQKLTPGIHSIEFGPEGATSGKPRHVQSFLITGAPIEISIEKTKVAFSVSATAADAPSVDIMAGGVYS